MDSVRTFNKQFQNDLPMYIKDNHLENQQEINQFCAALFMTWLMKQLGKTPEDGPCWDNESKNPINRFQMSQPACDGTILAATFVHVKNGRVIKGYSNISVLDSEWEDIKTIYKSV